MAYEKDKDYKALMDAAAAAGDYKAASQYEQQRNEKIADMGLGYEQTNTYQYDTPVKNVGGTDYYKNGTGYEGYDDGDLINYVTTPPSQLKKDAANGGGGALSGGGGGGGGFSYANAPAWASKYSSKIDQLMDAILGREAFSYNPATDPLYQQYSDQYTQKGNQAMQDTLGQVSARTGGLASTYATGAAQGAYNGYMQQLGDKIPELYQLAYSMYQDEGDRQMDNLSMLQGLEDTQYGRYQDSRDFNYGVTSDEWSRNFQQQQYADELAQLALENQRYDDETAYNREQDALAASKKTSGGGGGGSSGSQGYTSTRDQMVSMGITNDTDAFDYLINSGMSTTAATTLSKGYGKYYEQATGGSGDGDLSVDMASVINLGYGPIDAEFLNRLVENGVVEEYVENGKLKYRKVTSANNSSSLKNMTGLKLGG